MGEMVDQQFKIYFQVNSSLDRFIYRVQLGQILHFIFFYIFALIFDNFSLVLYFVLFFALKFVSTRPSTTRRIYSYSSGLSLNFFELRFLDSFEKTLVFLCIALFLFSFPEVKQISNTYKDLLSYLDPAGNLSMIQIISLKNIYRYYYDNIYFFRQVILNHYYIVNYGMFLLTCYSFFRYFFSRRTSLLGLFAILTTWDVTRSMAHHFGPFSHSSFPLFWVWALLWSFKGISYRSGLFVGLLTYWGVSQNIQYIYIIIPSLIFFYLKLMRGRTFWYKRQHFKYASFGLILCLFSVGYNISMAGFDSLNLQAIVSDFQVLLMGKAFYILGIMAPFVLFFSPRENFLIHKSFLFLFAIIFVIFILIQNFYLSSLIFRPILCVLLTYLALIPVEWLFLVHSRSRSFRNVIYVIYILVCLLDSHFEGRVKHFYNILGHTFTL